MRSGEKKSQGRRKEINAKHGCRLCIQSKTPEKINCKKKGKGHFKYSENIRLQKPKGTDVSVVVILLMESFEVNV